MASLASKSADAKHQASPSSRLKSRSRPSAALPWFVQTKLSIGEQAEDLQHHDAASSAGVGLESASKPLDSASRSFMERRFGTQFDRVRVHTDGQAAESAGSLNARAFTVGNDIIFGAGQYAPGTTAGDRLLAHELTHTVQQGGSSVVSAISTSSHGVVQRDTCTGRKFKTGLISPGSRLWDTVCGGQPCTTDDGKSGKCTWFGITDGCKCVPLPGPKDLPVTEKKPQEETDKTNEPSKVLTTVQAILLGLIKAALIAAGIMVTAAVVAAIIACLCGPCEVAALALIIGWSAAMIVIGIIKSKGSSGGSPTASTDSTQGTGTSPPEGATARA